MFKNFEKNHMMWLKHKKKFFDIGWTYTRVKQGLKILLILMGVWICQKIIFDYPLRQSYSDYKFLSSVHNWASLNYWRMEGGGGEAVVKIKTKFEKEKYHVDTVGCKIPATRLFTDFHLQAYYGIRWSDIKTEAGLADLLSHKFPAKQYVPDCRTQRKLSSLKEDDTILELHPKYVNQKNGEKCSLIEITPHLSSEQNFSSIDQGELDRRVDVTTMEMFVTRCGRHLNFDARFPDKPGVARKIEFWKKRKKPKKTKMEENEQEVKMNQNGENPINVLWIAFDSISRSQFHRAIPRTMKVLLEDLNFIDFRGYHAISPHTVHNLGGLLEGGGDSFIWNHYARHNYVTMFSNDNENSYNYGNWETRKEGERKYKIYEPPTDFFLRPLFAAQYIFANDRKYKCKQFCMSSEDSTSTFQLKYIEKFLRKYSKTPFFTFNWFNDPFHDTTLSLTDMDEPLVEFLGRIQKIENILENTLIIIQSDHGERYGFFETESIESYVERSLPGFFMRLPNKLNKMAKGNSSKMADMNSILRLNSRRLIYAHDIHHTLLHTLVLSGLDPTEKVCVSQFSAESTRKMRDRSSLFVPISEERTCKQLNIKADGSCICNSVVGEVTPVQNPFAIQKMISFAVQELNKIIEASKFSTKCRKRYFSIQPQISADALNENENFTEVLLRFEADPNDAQFEVKLRVATATRMGGRDEGADFQMERISSINRINKYGHDSWCVEPVQNDADKMMKEYCHCEEEYVTTTLTTTQKSMRTKNGIQ